MHIASIGLDLGKATFHLVAMGAGNKSAREEILTLAAAGLHRQPALVFDRSEACAGSHLLGAVRCAICDWFNKVSRVAKPHRQFTFGVKSHSSTASQNRFPRPHL